jgi:hypothetical protein
MPLAYSAGEKALVKFEQLRAWTKEAGRDPSEVGLEVWMSLGVGTPDDWRRDSTFWKNAGVSHIAGHATYNAGRHKRIQGRTVADHVAAVRSFIETVEDLK